MMGGSKEEVMRKRREGDEMKEEQETMRFSLRVGMLQREGDMLTLLGGKPLREGRREGAKW